MPGFPTGEDTAPRDSPRAESGMQRGLESVGNGLSEGAGNLLNITKSVSGNLLTVR